MYKKFSYFIATMFGFGMSPVAPGTVGSLATIPLAFVIAYFYSWVGIVVALVIVFIIGTIAVKEVLKYTSHDPSFIVIDETVGQLISFAFVADSLTGRNDPHVWLVYAVGFALFRVFDISKPWPVGCADKQIENEWGVLRDDVFAGLYAAVLLYIMVNYLPWYTAIPNL
ncbi:MAG: phosphatidylglycerophosphatase A [Endomicrobium sp.]|jgi:phosphatidylglycerophosphatase A|nr:phosphatidylglycerophosphatase A [Endomicrobium sp.]